MSEEIERRIEQSFREPDLVKKAVLEVSFGSKKVAKVMEMIGVLARVAEARTDQAADENPLTLELVPRAATLFLRNQHAMTEEQLRGSNFDIEEAVREVAFLAQIASTMIQTASA